MTAAKKIKPAKLTGFWSDRNFALEAVRVAALGKKGSVSALLATLG